MLGAVKTIPDSLLLAALHLLSLILLVLSAAVRASLVRDDSPRLGRTRAGKDAEHNIASGL